MSKNLSQLIQTTSASELDLIFDEAQKRETTKKIPSPLPNKKQLQDELQALTNEAYEPDCARLCATVERVLTIAVADKLDDKNSYQKRLVEFTNYIKGRWGAHGENDDTRKRLTKSLYEFFLQQHDIDFEVLVAQFPPQPEDFNCFYGICERVDAIRKPQNHLLQILTSARQAALSKAFEGIRKTVTAENQVHAHHYFELVLRGSDLAPQNPYRISSAALLAQLNLFPHLFHEMSCKATADQQEFSKEEIAALGKKIIEKNFKEEEGEKLKKLLSEEGSVLLADDYALKTKFEEALIIALREKFSVPTLEEELFENVAETEDDGYLLKLKFEALLEAIKKLSDQAQTVEFKDLAALPHIEAFAYPNSSITQFDVREFYSHHSTDRIIALLSSTNADEIVEGINIIFALSHASSGSPTLHILNSSIALAATRLHKTFEKKISDPTQAPFYKKILPRLEVYLERQKHAKEYFAQTSAHATDILSRKEISPEFCKSIPDSQLLFIICNASSEDALRIIENIDAKKLRQMFVDYRDEFGKTVSSFTLGDHLYSLSLRPDFAEIFPKLCEKIYPSGMMMALYQGFPDFTKQKTEVFLYLIMSARLSGNKAAADVAVRTLRGIDPDSLELRDLEETFLFPYLSVKEPIAADDPFLPFLKRFNLATTEIGGRTPLQVAVALNHAEAVKALIRAGADVKIKTPSQGYNLLMIAAMNGCAEVAKILVENGINIRETNRSPLTAFHIAANHNCGNVIRAIANAFRGKREELVGAINIPSVNGFTPLMAAAKLNNIGAIIALLEIDKGNINARNSYNNTALGIAAEYSNLAVVRMLVENGAETNSKDESFPPLLYAITYGSEELRDYLLSQGARLSELHIHKMILTLLIKSPSPKNTQSYQKLSDYFRETNPLESWNQIINRPPALLISAVIPNKSDAVKILIRDGADVNIRGEQNSTALMHAANYNNEEIVETLIEARANLDLRDNQKNTALMFAAMHGNLKVAEILVQAGANLEGREAGKSFYDYAPEDKKKEFQALALLRTPSGEPSHPEGAAAAVKHKPKGKE